MTDETPQPDEADFRRDAASIVGTMVGIGGVLASLAAYDWRLGLVLSLLVIGVALLLGVER